MRPGKPTANAASAAAEAGSELFEGPFLVGSPSGALLELHCGLKVHDKLIHNIYIYTYTYVFTYVNT